MRQDLLRPFPEQDPADRRAGDAALDRLRALLREWIDPAEVDELGRLPEGFLRALADAGLLKLTIDPALGGLGLSLVNAMRVVELAASWCTPVAFALAITNGFGSGSYLPVLPAGPLRDMISARVTAGIVSAGADAEAIGTANQRRATVAVPVEDGAAYLLTGEKVFIGNGPVADLMDVSATVTAADGSDDVRLFFVDSRSPGFSVTARHEFMGLRGAAIGTLRLDAVRVPAEHMMDEQDGWRMRPNPSDVDDTEPTHRPDGGDLGWLAAVGRTMVIAPAALALARRCLAWSRDFVSRRDIDGRNLGDYDEIQRLVAASAADVFMIESIVTWCLLAQDRADTLPDLTAAKNLASLACWRVVDRTMSLLGAEGYETALSKARRGAPALPVERAFRDARALRIAGGVDFMLDLWSARSVLTSYDRAADAPGLDRSKIDSRTNAAGRDHLTFVSDHADDLAEVCRRLTRTVPPEELFERQRTMIVLGQIGAELLSMSVVVARAAELADQGSPSALALADISCAASRHRLAALWPQLTDQPDCAATSQQWLHGSDLDFLMGDPPVDDPTPTIREGVPAHA